MLTLFDTHAHLDAEQFDEDRAAVAAALPCANVSLMLNPGCTLSSSAKAVALAEQYPHIYAAVGIHPEECGSYQTEQLAELKRLALSTKCVAIGEIGLDYHGEQNPPPERQQRAFREQMALAQELTLPVIVHDRDAHEDSLDIIREFPAVRGVFHCFSGSVEMARELVRLGWMISFTGVLTYKNARRAVEVAQAIDLTHIMVETDSPYMAPVPHRGERNDPRLVYHVCERLAELTGVSVEECAAVTCANGKRLFGI